MRILYGSSESIAGEVNGEFVGGVLKQFCKDIDKYLIEPCWETMGVFIIKEGEMKKVRVKICAEDMNEECKKDEKIEWVDEPLEWKEWKKQRGWKEG